MSKSLLFIVCSVLNIVINSGLHLYHSINDRFCLHYGVVLRRNLKVVLKMGTYGLNQKQPSEERSNKETSQPAKQQNTIPAKPLAQRCPPSA